MASCMRRPLRLSRRNPPWRRPRGHASPATHFGRLEGCDRCSAGLNAPAGIVPLAAAARGQAGGSEFYRIEQDGFAEELSEFPDECCIRHRF